jgi:hypothetical protein
MKVNFKTGLIVIVLIVEALSLAARTRLFQKNVAS